MKSVYKVILFGLGSCLLLSACQDGSSSSSSNGSVSVTSRSTIGSANLTITNNTNNNQQVGFSSGLTQTVAPHPSLLGARSLSALLTDSTPTCTANQSLAPGQSCVIPIDGGDGTGNVTVDGNSIATVTYTTKENQPYVLAYAGNYYQNNPSESNVAATLYVVNDDNSLTAVNSLGTTTGVGDGNPAYMYYAPSLNVTYFGDGDKLFAWDSSTSTPQQIATLGGTNGDVTNIQAISSFTATNGHTDIIFGGNFTSVTPVNGNPLNTNSLVVYDPTDGTWSSIGSLSTGPGIIANDPVSAQSILVDSNTGKIYVGGHFPDIEYGDHQFIQVNNLATYDIESGAWSNTNTYVGSQSPNANPNDVRSLALLNLGGTPYLFTGNYEQVSPGVDNSILTKLDLSNSSGGWQDTGAYSTPSASDILVYNVSGDADNVYVLTANTTTRNNDGTTVCNNDTNAQCVEYLSKYSGTGTSKTDLDSNGFAWDGHTGGITTLALDPSGNLYAGGLFAGVCTNSGCTGTTTSETQGFSAYENADGSTSWKSMPGVPTGTLPYTTPFPLIPFAGLGAVGNAPYVQVTVQQQ